MSLNQATTLHSLGLPNSRLILTGFLRRSLVFGDLWRLHRVEVRLSIPGLALSTVLPLLTLLNPLVLEIGSQTVLSLMLRLHASSGSKRLNDLVLLGGPLASPGLLVGLVRLLVLLLIVLTVDSMAPDSILPLIFSELVTTVSAIVESSLIAVVLIPILLLLHALIQFVAKVCWREVLRQRRLLQH